MANDQISLDEYLAQLNSRVEAEDYKALGLKWEANPIEQLTFNSIDPLTTYGSGTSHPSYGAMPNVTTVNGINISPTIWTTNATAGQYSFTGQNIQPGNTVHIRGEDADLLINEKSLKTWMERVEEQLNILTPNPELEKEWDQLRKLGERYRKLEKKCKGKSDTWNKLKAMPKPEIK